MDPITIMRNALGKEEGGSGVPIDREVYKASVNFWSKHAIIKWNLFKLSINMIKKNILIK